MEKHGNYRLGFRVLGSPRVRSNCEQVLSKALIVDTGVSQNYGYLFGSPHNKDYSILGSILGFPYFGKLPYSVDF